MSKPKLTVVENPKPVKVLQVFEDSEIGGYCRGFVVREIEIDEDLLKKHGKIVSETVPDKLSNCLNALSNKAQDFLGL